jgi:hypothetical protein
MKSFFHYFLTSLLFLGMLTTASAQNDGDDGYGGHWFLGLSGGAAWSQGDAKIQPGGGWSIYLGKNILYSPTAPLSLDLRMRYLGTLSYGQDYQLADVSTDPVLNGTIPNPFSGFPSYDSLFHNHRTGFHDLSLEARLNFENLRRKHRIWFSLYGGIGVGWYRVAYDQIDERVFGFEQNYNYNDLNLSGLSDRQIANELVSFRDGEFDTWSDGSMLGVDGGGDFDATFTPSLGFELGYWVTPRFAVGIGHRATWTFRDDFDAVSDAERGPASGDIHHYANLFLHGVLNEPSKDPVRPIPDPVRVDPPQVNITNPPTSPYTHSGNQLYNIRATIRNVEQNSGVTFTVNGQNVTNYTFNPSTDKFTAFVNLQPGTNTIQVQGVNSAGSDQDVAIINYQTVNNNNPNTNPNPPTVNITQPAANPYTSPSSTTIIRATITNIPTRAGISFTVNGQVNTNFNFSGNNFIATGVNLQQGNNTIVINASNTDGNASDQTVIIYQPVRQQNPPTVNITQPSANPFNTQSSSTTIRATITNVPSRSNVSFTVNGQNVTNFNYSGTSFVATGVNLQQGNNTVVITGTNQDGTASDQTTIIYQPVRQQNPPTVNITVPSANPYTSPSSSTIIRATITNVPSRSNVSFTVNGQNITNFNYSGSNFIATGVNLQQGNNTVVITGTNQDGTASDQTTIIYQPVRQQNPPTVDITVPSANPFNTSNPTATINATIVNVASSNQVSFMVNNQTVNNFSFNPTTNQFTATINLQQGSNSVQITGSNNDGVDFDNTTINYQPVRQSTPPTVNITVPSANPFNTQSSSTTIRATITNVPTRAGVNFTVNGQNVTNFSYSGTNFTATGVNLQQGNNTVVVKGTNQDGTASDQTVIIYQPVRQPTPPTVNITVPAANPFNTQSSSTTIRATITNVPTRAGVNFTVNGQNVTNFSYSGTNFTATGVNLQQGNNTVVVKGTNQDGTASDQTVIIYQPVRQPTPPTVNITVPAANPFNTSSASTTIKATITNVPTRAGVNFTVNGQNVTNFSYSGTNFTATGVNLQQGNNTVVITGTNQDGTASDQTVIIYQPVRQPTPPTVNITVPAANPFNTSSASTTIKATITNVPTRAGVSFTVNGQNVTNFSYSGTNFTATGVNLQQGNNTVVVKGTNQDGTASDQTVIIYQPVRQPTPPTVNITTPSADPYQSPSQTTTIKATITNVPTRAGVSFTLNGQNVTTFNYSGTSFVATGVNLQQGNNTVVVKGTNQDGAASDQTVIIYKPLPGPAVNITQPAANPATVQTDKVTIVATVDNVANANNVTFTVNGQPDRNFTLNGNNFTAPNVSLNQGNNTFVIVGTNPQGSASDQTVVVYNPPVQPPTVDITTPSSNPYNSPSQTTTIRATIKHVTSRNNVAFAINGQYLTNFSFSGQNFTATNVPLNQGSNTVTISAQNNAGQDSDVTTINYNPVSPPQIYDFSAGVQPQTAGGCIVRVTAGTRNVSNRNEISFKVNGQNHTSFNFNPSTGVVEAVFNINSDNPSTITYSITATTAGGTVTESTTANVGNCGPRVSPPDVKSTSIQVKQELNKCFAIVSSRIVNVDNRNGVSFKVNGRTDNSFTYNNGVFSAKVDVTNVTSSSISIVVTGTNSAGTDSESKTASMSSCNSGNNNPNTVNPNTGTITNPPNGGNTGNTTAKPTVNFTAPRLGRATRTPTTVKATVTGVSQKSQITFKVNGQNVTNFSLSGTSFTANSVALNSGNNSVQIIATNAGGTTTKSFNITFTGGGGGGTGDRNAGDNNNNKGRKGTDVEKSTDGPKKVDNKTTDPKSRGGRGGTNTNSTDNKSRGGRGTSSTSNNKSRGGL